MADLLEMITRKQDELRGYPLPPPTRWERLCEASEPVIDFFDDHGWTIALIFFAIAAVAQCVALGLKIAMMIEGNGS